MFDWNDLRYFLATARHESTLKASAALGVNQTTVARRIKALETALGVALFRRQQSGYRITEEGRAVLDLATAAEKAADALEHKIRSRQRNVSGTVRVTGTEYMARALLAPAASLLRTRHSGINAEIIVSDRRLDLAAGEADIALRAGGANEQPDIVRRRMPDTLWAIYASRAFLHDFGMPESEADIARYPVIVGEGIVAAAPPIAYLESKAGPGRIAFRSNSLPGLVAAAESGLGLAALPAIAAAGTPELLRCDALPSFPAQLWICWHESRRDDPLIRLVSGVLSEVVMARAGMLRGKMAASPTS